MESSKIKNQVCFQNKSISHRRKPFDSLLEVKNSENTMTEKNQEISANETNQQDDSEDEWESYKSPEETCNTDSEDEWETYGSPEKMRNTALTSDDFDLPDDLLISDTLLMEESDIVHSRNSSIKTLDDEFMPKAVSSPKKSKRYTEDKFHNTAAEYETFNSHPHYLKEKEKKESLNSTYTIHPCNSSNNTLDDEFTPQGISSPEKCSKCSEDTFHKTDSGKYKTFNSHPHYLEEIEKKRNLNVSFRNSAKYETFNSHPHYLEETQKIGNSHHSFTKNSFDSNSEFSEEELLFPENISSIPFPDIPENIQFQNSKALCTPEIELLETEKTRNQIAIADSKFNHTFFIVDKSNEKSGALETEADNIFENLGNKTIKLEKISTNTSKTLDNTDESTTENSSESDTSEDKSETLKNTTEDKSETLENTAEDKSETLENTAEDKFETFENTADDRSETFENTTKDKSETLENTAEDKSETLEEPAEDKSETLENTAEDSLKTLKNTTKEISNNLENTLINESGGLKNLTRDKSDHSGNEVKEVSRNSEKKNMSKNLKGRLKDVTNQFTNCHISEGNINSQNSFLSDYCQNLDRNSKIGENHFDSLKNNSKTETDAHTSKYLERCDSFEYSNFNNDSRISKNKSELFEEKSTEKENTGNVHESLKKDSGNETENISEKLKNKSKDITNQFIDFPVAEGNTNSKSKYTLRSSKNKSKLFEDKSIKKEKNETYCENLKEYSKVLKNAKPIKRRYTLMKKHTKSLAKVPVCCLTTLKCSFPNSSIRGSDDLDKSF